MPKTYEIFLSFDFFIGALLDFNKYKYTHVRHILEKYRCINNFYVEIEFIIIVANSYNEDETYLM
jgi:hypothetical protein